MTSESDVAAIFETHPPHLVVGVEEHPLYRGNLVFQPADNMRQAFYDDHGDWLSRYLTLNDLFLLGPFVERLESENYRLIFMPSTKSILDDYRRWHQPLDIDRFHCPNDGQLFGYQTFGLRRALDRSEAQEASDRLFFVNWCAGAGKSLFACAGAQELINRGQVDLVLAVTSAPLKEGFLRFFRSTTNLDTALVEGSPEKRRQKYQQDRHGFILNYDRFRFDQGPISEITQGRRVLFVFDEVQNILTEKGPTQTRTAIDEIVLDCEPTVWAMSASVVRASPLRWRDVFSLDGHPRQNPLGTKADFERRYVKNRTMIPIKTRTGGYFNLEKVTWDLTRLHEVRHRIADRVHAVRKTDPVIRDFFKGMKPITTPVQLSKEDQALYDMVDERAKKAFHEEEGLGLPGYAILLRHICNNPAALRVTDVEYAAEVCAAHPKLINSNNCNKLAMLLDQVEGIRDAGDKTVIFTQWVEHLKLLSDAMAKRKIEHVDHHGGMTRKRATEAVDRFRSTETVTVLLSSDAGAYGLNLPEARYVISYEPTFSWDTLMQRSERINRADSWLDGLTAYTFVTDDTCEVEIAAICEERRLLASTTMGTTETLSTASEDESPRLAERLIFGPHHD